MDQYRTSKRDGLRGLRDVVWPGEIEELMHRAEELTQGKLPERQRHQMQVRNVSKDHDVAMQGLDAPPAQLSPINEAFFFPRIHVLHRKLALHGQYRLAGVADRYGQILVTAKAGDVVCFKGIVPNRSKENHSTDRLRCAFVSHYCITRSFTQSGAQPKGDRALTHTPR